MKADVSDSDQPSFNHTKAKSYACTPDGKNEFCKDLEMMYDKRSQSNDGDFTSSIIQDPRLSIKEVFKLGEISHERLEKPREFFAY